MKVIESRPAGAASRKKAQPAQAPEDHRVRTGAARREQTRRKLLESALQVFAEKGPDAPLIEDFIAAAGVARGTFYNYFKTTQDLLDAVTSELSDEILASIDVVVLRLPNALERMVCGCLLYMHFSVDVPGWGEFISRTGARSKAIGKLVDVYLPRDLGLAQQAGELRFPTVRAARDLVLGCVTQGVQTVLAGDAPKHHLRQTLALALQGMGITPDRAGELCSLPLPEVTLPHGFGFSTLLRSQTAASSDHAPPGGTLPR